ncbi:hypothetical protein Tcan_10477 [Toxocara canis]|uniref:Uncharacterized protein n=1 Tax=Toxocara canis TaxID=6265 RepID=A0A0B2V7X6_TOXCA|nr:hypothetical protein Tcan_10477 [Toxocara canis]
MTRSSRRSATSERLSRKPSTVVRTSIRCSSLRLRKSKTIRNMENAKVESEESNQVKADGNAQTLSEHGEHMNSIKHKRSFNPMRSLSRISRQRSMIN